MGQERFHYPWYHREWECPSARCNFTLRTQPTRYAPGHRCNPDAPSTHHYLKPTDKGTETIRS